MTKEQQNDIIKRVWTEHLQHKDDIPESLADNYSIWLRAKIREAVPQLSTSQDGSQQGEQGEQGDQEEQVGGPEGMPPEGGPEGGPEGMPSPPNVEATQAAAGGM